MYNPTDAAGSQEAAEATVPGTWPGGEPAKVRAAEIPVKPSWLALSFDCPPWCEWPDEHREHDHYDDRVHTARPIPEVVMTAATLLGDNREDEPDTVSACIHQHYREREPRIQVECNEQVTGIELTPSEAEAFGDLLLKLAAIARAK